MTGLVLWQRLVVWALLLAIAGVTVSLQIDRQTRLSPQLFAVVPGPFKSQALEPEADLAVKRKAANAYELAREFVQRRPVPSLGLTLLSLSAVEKRDNQLADDAMALAASRGWRGTVPNLLALGGAYAAGDLEGAVHRLAALGRMQAGEQITKQGLAIISASPEGRAVLSDYAKRDPAMAFMVLRSSLEVIRPELAVEMVRDIKAGGGTFSCPDIRWIVTSLLRLGKGSEALELWGKGCELAPPSDRKGALASADPADPFAWQLQRAPGLSRSIRSDHVRFRNKDPLDRIVADRFLVLKPGRYRIEALTEAPVNRASTREARVTLLAGCRPSDVRRPINRDTNVIDVPADCPVLQLSLRINRGEARVKDVAIERFGGAQ